MGVWGTLSSQSSLLGQFQVNSKLCREQVSQLLRKDMGGCPLDSAWICTCVLADRVLYMHETTDLITNTTRSKVIASIALWLEYKVCVEYLVPTWWHYVGMLWKLRRKCLATGSRVLGMGLCLSFLHLCFQFIIR